MKQLWELLKRVAKIEKSWYGPRRVEKRWSQLKRGEAKWLRQSDDEFTQQSWKVVRVRCISQRQTLSLDPMKLPPPALRGFYLWQRIIRYSKLEQYRFHNLYMFQMVSARVSEECSSWFSAIPALPLTDKVSMLCQPRIRRIRRIQPTVTWANFAALYMFELTIIVGSAVLANLFVSRRWVAMWA